MFCPTCGSEILGEMKYCNRCGTSLATVAPTYPVIQPPKPIKLTLPSIVFGLTICIGIGSVIAGAVSLAEQHIHPAAIAWIVIACMATLFGTTALMLRFWMKVLTVNRETYQQFSIPPAKQAPMPAIPPPRFIPQLQPQPSVTEHTTRTFSPLYREGSDPEKR